MERRKSIVEKVLEGFKRGIDIQSYDSEDVHTDHRLLYKMFSRRKDIEELTITEDPGKGLLWFKRRKN